MDLSIIIVNWNTRDLLSQALQSVYETVQGLEFEVFVVDNASTDSSADMVRQRFADVRLISNAENVGFARANNQAMRESAGSLVLLLNSDARVTGDCVAQLAGLMVERADVGIVGPRLQYPDGRPQVAHGPLPSLGSEVRSLFGLDRLDSRNGGRAVSSQLPVETGCVCGACMMARRQLFDEVGLLDEEYFMFSEEIDLCFRARKAGWKVVHLPGALAIHVGGGSTGVTPERILRLYRGKLQYFAKHEGQRARGAFLGAVWVATTLKVAGYTLLGLFSQRRAQKAALWRAVAQGLTASV